MNTGTEGENDLAKKGMAIPSTMKKTRYIIVLR
jgi:hypothetical protein